MYVTVILTNISHRSEKDSILVIGWRGMSQSCQLRVPRCTFSAYITLGVSSSTPSHKDIILTPFIHRSVRISAMVGVPSSRGCNTCRKAKKKVRQGLTQIQDKPTNFHQCDLAKPKCGRCTRVGGSCTGGGLQRFRFHEYKPIAAPPSNGTTQLASAFVSMIGITDERYSFELYGPRFFKGLPQRFGSHAALDDMTSAVIASFQSVRLRKESNSKALALYGKALRSLQTCLQDPKQPAMLKLELVIMMMLCQVCLERESSRLS